MLDRMKGSALTSTGSQPVEEGRKVESSICTWLLPTTAGPAGPCWRQLLTDGFFAILWRSHAAHLHSWTHAHTQTVLHPHSLFLILIIILTPPTAPAKCQTLLGSLHQSIVLQEVSPPPPPPSQKEAVDDEEGLTAVHRLTTCISHTCDLDLSPLPHGTLKIHVLVCSLSSQVEAQNLIDSSATDRLSN